MNLPIIVAASVVAVFTIPFILLFIFCPPKPVDPCKVIDAFGDAVVAGRRRSQQDKHKI